MLLDRLRDKYTPLFIKSAAFFFRRLGSLCGRRRRAVRAGGCAVGAGSAAPWAVPTWDRWPLCACTRLFDGH